jgi:hypothetical protein
LDDMGCEEQTPRAAVARAGSGRPRDEVPVRKHVAMWQAYNDRRWRFERDLLQADDRAPFVCECTSDECVQAVELTMLEYEAAHMCPAWTAVIPGHVIDGDGSRVLTKHAHFWIVELYPVFDRNRV